MRMPMSRIVTFIISPLFVAIALTLGGPSAAVAQNELGPIDVIGVTPMPGTGIERDRVPTSVQTLESEEFDTLSPRNLTDLMEQRLSGVTVKDIQNSPYQQNIDYRGYTLSPLLGEAQGLAVYMNGVRVNEAFGDTMQWELVPEAAIDRIDLTGANPVFGLNALGGALAIRTKRGLDWRGAEAQVLGGSFGRMDGSAELGVGSENSGLYAAFESGREDGWRDFSDSDIRRFFGDFGHEGESHEIGFSILHGDTMVTGNGATPEDLLAVRRESVFTWPDITENRLTMPTVRGLFEIGDGTTLSALAYFRNLDRDTVNGDEFDAMVDDDGFVVVGEDDDDDDGNGDDDEDGGAEVRYLFDDDGRPIRVPGDDDDEITIGARNLTFTQSDSWGLALQADREFGSHVLTAGIAYDQSDTMYRGHTLVGHLQDDRGVPPLLIDGETVTVGGQCEADDFEEGDEEQCGEDGDELQSSDADPLDVTSDTTSLGLYATDTYRLSDRTDLTVSARYNHTKLNLDLHDGEGEASHTFQRINPAIGLTHRPFENFAVYGGYREANRAPTPAELSCASPDDPCRLPNAFIADPPLEQVVARTIEAGLRGRTGSAKNGMGWEASAYASRNDDDLIFVAVPGDQPGLGYFQNFGDTQRIGLELAAQGRSGSVDWFANYSFLAATFEEDGELPGANHPRARTAEEDDEDEDDNGDDGDNGDDDDDENKVIDVSAGDRIPGLPDHTFKAGIGFRPMSGLRVGANMVARTGVYLRGDESNQLDKTSSYAVFNVTADYTYRNLTVFGRIENVFDHDYETFGILGECEFEGEDECEGEVPILNHGLEDDVHHTNRFLSPGAPRGFYVGLRYRW